MSNLIRHVVAWLHQGLALLVLAVALGPSAAGAAVQLSTADQGHIRLGSFIGITDVTHFEFDTAMKVDAVLCCGGPQNAFVGERAYAFFAIPLTIDPAGAATLRFDTNLAGPASRELTAQEIFSPLAPFQFNYADDDATGIGLFNDLGNGPVYAGTTVLAGNSSFALALNGAALQRIDTVRGSFFGIGFSTPTASDGNLLTLSNMVLEIAPVPEPAVFWLMLAGLAWLFAWQRRTSSGRSCAPAAPRR